VGDSPDPGKRETERTGAEAEGALDGELIKGASFSPLENPEKV
jgi:hypothetical protein